jgi:hypothetical protein
MTHDEFVAEVNKDIDQAPLVKDYYPVRALLALRAIVELHKPIDDSGIELCQECTRISSTRINYPCPTIRTAQEELW